MEAETEIPIIIPPYTIEEIFTPKSQVIDWSLTALGIPAHWKDTQGEGIRVGIADTGLPRHTDLQGALGAAEDFTGSRTVHDMQGHSSHVSGIVAARNNETGCVGVAPKSEVVIAKVLGDSGSGNNRSVAAGIRWLVSQKVHIISLSLGSPQPDGAIKAAIDAALGEGIFVVAAAGNEGPSLNTIGYPARYPGVISVGAIDRRKEVTQFSSRGERVDIVAPGDRIISTWLNNELSSLSGTSMACPFVAGVMALILAKHKKLGGDTPVMTPKQMIDHLRKTAVDLGSPGFDVHSGFGLINPDQLLQLWGPPLVPPVSPDVNFNRTDFTESGYQKAAKVFGEFKELKFGRTVTLP